MQYMKDLISLLNKHTELYDKGIPEISDKDWDSLYFELQKLEKETGIIYPNSPTQKINYEVKSELTKIQHNHSLLSLSKTKSIEDLELFIKDKLQYTVMAKMDGLTISVRYMNGELISAETRGDGVRGEDILHNAKMIKNLPQHINYMDELIIDGEAIITYSDFKQFSNEYANPRNLVSGSIRLLDAKESAKRNISFIAWKVYKGFEGGKYYSSKLQVLQDELGFTVVPMVISGKHPRSIEEDIEFIKNKSQELGYPIDGCVIGIDDIEEAAAMGPATAHHEQYQIAYKFADEEYETKLLDIIYDVSRTGQLTPVAVFEDVDTGDSICNKASLHNLSVLEKLSGGFERKGDIVTMIKSNEIIPQIIKWEHIGNYSEENHINIPKVCPICGGDTEIRQDGVAKILYCTNPKCQAKLANQIEHYCSKKALDIHGISRKTIDFLINKGWLTSIKDLYNLEFYSGQWKHESGWGERSVEKILAAIKESCNFNLQKFIVAIGIPEIGTIASKELVKKYPTWEKFRNASYESLVEIDGFGEVMADNILNFNYVEADYIYENYMNKIEVEVIEEIFQEARDIKKSAVAGKNFVLTGTMSKPRSVIIADIEAAGGSVKSSVSKNTNYLVNSDINSTTGKNKRAKELEIPIISEEELYKMIKE